MGIPDRTTVSRNEYLVIGNERKKTHLLGIDAGEGDHGRWVDARSKWAACESMMPAHAWTTGVVTL